MASASSDIEIITRFGPYGNQSGEQYDDGEHFAAMKMEIAHDDNMVYGFRVQYRDSCCAKSWSDWHWKKEGQVSEVAFPGEQVGRFAGVSNKDRSLGIIKSLTIDSMKMRYGPFGSSESDNAFDVPFEVDLSDYRVLGFFGTAHVSLSSIGIISKKKA